MRIIKNIFFILIILVSFTACHTKRIVVDNNVKVNHKEIKPAPEVIKAVDSIKANYSDYKTLNIKFTAEYLEKEKSTIIKGLMRIKRDSFIWISVRPGLGIELARILFTPDSIKFIDRMHHEYFLGDYIFLEKKFNIKLNYRTLQSILTDEFYIYPDTLISRANLAGFSLIDTIPNCLLRKKSAVDSSYNIQETLYRKNDYKIVSNYINFVSDNRYIDIKFNEFDTFSDKLLPVKFTTIFKSKLKEISLNLKYDKVSENKPVTSSFKIAKSYKPISFDK